jgi:hypothetical protein
MLASTHREFDLLQGSLDFCSTIPEQIALALSSFAQDVVVALEKPAKSCSKVDVLKEQVALPSRHDKSSAQ